MHFSYKIIFGLSISLIALICFGAQNFIYNFSSEPRYYNKEVVGNDLIVEKKFSDGTQEHVYWRIRPEELPTTEHLCNENTFDLCLKNGDGCFKPCFQYGPKLISYAKNVDKIYFSIDTTEVGATGIGSRFLFVGDLNKRKIKYLAITAGLLEYKYSPNKNYIVFYTNNELTITNTLNDEITSIHQRNTLAKHYREVHYLDSIHWISNNHFTYLDTSYGFDKNPTKVIQNIYDINTHTTIDSKKIR